MITTRFASISKLAAGMAVAFIWLFGATSAASAAQGYCYEKARYDTDNDGYASVANPTANGFLTNLTDGRCPDDYVSRAGDCDDTEASVHPYRTEIALNGRDDNCNDKTDEPDFLYATLGNNNTTSAFDMQVRLNRESYRTAANDNTLWVEVTFVRLENSANPVTNAKVQVTRFNNARTLAYLTLSGLSSGKVYRSKVLFHRRNANATFTTLGSSSDWYYTMTDSNTDKVHTRSLIVRRGFEQFDESQDGAIGYMGNIAMDGTRFGARPNEAWCTEFYAWVAGEYLRNMGAQNDVGDMREYFRDRDSWKDAFQIPETAGPGDYLYLDTDDDGDANHSGMFLAYDLSQDLPVVWSLEGNWGNRVKVNQRPADWIPVTHIIRAFGYILNSMIR